MPVTLDDIRTHYGLFALTMHPDWTYTHFQQNILAPVLDRIALGDPEFRRTMFTLPFRHSKTEFCVETFLTYYFGRNPSNSVILVSYGKTIARKSGRAIREMMKSEMYQALFPHSIITTYSRAQDEFETISGGKFFAGGFDSGVNGRGAHLLAIDDPSKSRQEATSETVMSSVRDTYNSVVRTRLEPNASIMITSTRWTPADVCGWQIGEHGGFDYLENKDYTDDEVREAA